MSKRAVALAVSAAVVLTLIVFGVVLSRQRVRRHRVFRPAAGEVRPQPPSGIPGVERWTEAFQSLDAEELDDLLDELEQRHPEQYKKWWLGYLHARALIEHGEEREAAQRLAAGPASAPGGAFGLGGGMPDPAELNDLQLPPGFEKFLGR